VANRSPQLTRTSVKQRIVYQDFSPNLDVLPITGELLILKNAQAVAQSIRNLVLTILGERYYAPLVGSTVNKALFDFVDDFTMDQIRDSIVFTIQNYEPRAQNVNVTVTGIPTQNQVQVDIFFTIVVSPGQTFSVPTMVLPVRG
jgi:phage baseplate assembly protein W